MRYGRRVRARLLVVVVGLAAAGAGLVPAAAAAGDVVVTVEPATGLVDGQVVDITATGLDGTLFEMFQCRADAVDETGCDPENAYFAGTDSTGTVRERFPVDARIHDMAGREYDCRQAPFACKIGVGFLADFPLSGFVAIDFDAGAPLAPAPTIQIRPSGGVRDGQRVAVRGANLSPRFETFAYQCVAGRPWGGAACNFDQDVRGVATEKGKLVLGYRVEGLLFPSLGGAPFDCTAAPGACVIGISIGFTDTPDRFATAPITFRARRDRRDAVAP